jgi:Mg/Co/Ni transporter MgtE
MRCAKELMTTSVPMAQPDETVGVALERLRELKPEEASHLYLIDEASVLTGQVPIERLIAAAQETRLGDPPIEVRLDDDAELVALLVVERHDGIDRDLIVTHNMALARRASDECVFMLLGELIEHRRTEDFFSNPHNAKTAEYIEGRFG